MIAVARNLLYSTAGELRVGRLFALDVVLCFLLSLAVMLHIVALLPALLIGYPALVVGNLVILFRDARRTSRLTFKGLGVRKSIWLAVGAFTAGSLIAFVNAVLKPSSESAIQGLIATVLAAYMWFVVYRLVRLRG